MVSKKGISTPISMIIIISISLVILFVLFFFFSSRIGISMGEVEANQIFFQGCSSYCDDINFSGTRSVASFCNSEGNEFRNKFLTSCKILGYTTEDKTTDQCLRCFRVCSSCGLVSSKDGINNAVGDFAGFYSYFVE